VIIGVGVFMLLKLKKARYFKSLRAIQEGHDAIGGKKDYAPRMLDAIQNKGIRSVTQLASRLHIDRENVVRIIKVMLAKGQIKNLELDLAGENLVIPKFIDKSKLPKDKVCADCGVKYFVPDDVTKCVRCGGPLIEDRS
jgi:hypothetical protein